MTIAEQVAGLWQRWESAVDFVFNQNRPFFHITIFAVAVFLIGYLIAKAVDYSARKLKAGRNRYIASPVDFHTYNVVRDPDSFGSENLEIAVSNNSFKVDGDAGKAIKGNMQNGDKVRVFLRYKEDAGTFKNLIFTAILRKKNNSRAGTWEANDCRKIAFSEQLIERLEPQIDLSSAKLSVAKIERNENPINALGLAAILRHPSRDIRLAMIFFYLSIISSGLFMALDKVFF